jgi:hypothetical protein
LRRLRLGLRFLEESRTEKALVRAPFLFDMNKTTVYLNVCPSARMDLYLYPVELQARVHAGKEVEQWLGHAEEGEYTVIKWLYLAQEEQDRYSVNYLESFDEGDEEWQIISEFSLLDPDAKESIVFDSVKETVAYAVQIYGASPDRFIPGVMLAEEYARYWQSKNASSK